MTDYVVINAPVDKVWEVFADFESYLEWNPFLRSFEGIIAPEEKVSVKMDMGVFVMPIKPVLTVVDPPNEVSWVVKQGPRFVYTVDRHFRFHPLGPDRTHFVQSETSRGLMSPVISAFLQRPALSRISGRPAPQAPGPGDEGSGQLGVMFSRKFATQKNVEFEDLEGPGKATQD